MATEFRHDLGNVSLDFLATVRDWPGRHIDRLETADDLSRWLGEAGFAEEAPVSKEQLEEARALRDSIYRLLQRARDEGRVPSPQAAFVNEWARKATFAPQIGPSFSRVTVSGNVAAAALAHIARESVELVTGPDLARVRKCAGCSLLFVDRSRPGSRRWCSMDRCGNREKMARYRKKAHD
ncbi:MAG TPA: ABATE domain-containing protein [Gaiellaceae bacterium]